MTANDAARELLRENPNASPGVVKKHAESLSDDPDFVQEVIRTYFDLRTRQRKFASDVDRIWPDKKGY